MKIVEVCAYYPPHIGGIEFVAKNLAKCFAASGHGVTVLTSTVGSLAAGTVSSDHLNETYLRGFEFAHTPVMPSLPYKLLRIDRKSSIHVHLSHVYTEIVVMCVAKLRRMPYVAHYHMDVDTSGKLGFLYKFYKKALLPFVVRGAKRVIALSEEQRGILINRYGAKPTNVVVIPNGVNEEYFLEHKRVFKNKPLTLLFVGRFAQQKNLARLIQTIPLLKVPVELHLVGGGEKQNELELLVQKLKINNVHFEGPKSGQALVDAYKQADVFILTSDREGMPLVLLEAAAAALPIVASDVQGLREFIADNGVLVKNPSPETFAATLNKLLAEPNELLRLSQASSLWAQSHRWSRLAQKVIEVLDDAR